MPAEVEMTKAERFMRGIKPEAKLASPWERLDSVVIVDTKTGRRLSDVKWDEVNVQTRETPVRSPSAPIVSAAIVPAPLLYMASELILLEGRIGERRPYELTVYNDAAATQVLHRLDTAKMIKTRQKVLSINPKEEGKLLVEVVLPAGGVTHALIMGQGDALRLEARFSLNGYDLCEEDFVGTTNQAALPIWKVPAGRETLYLRLRSTEKLMTVYAQGDIYNKVAVGRQLDELSLVGLAAGYYLLEVIDLATGQKRYHGLQR